MERLPDIPRVGSATDILLLHIYHKLESIETLLAAERPITVITSQSYPADSPPVSSPLPADFPGREALEAAGIMALADVPRTVKQLKALAGIGEVTATAILRELGK